jgi:DNA mismatch repair protein MutS
MIIITGPNMAGKSALLRQTALITLMAQIGSYVPAENAKLGLVDKIFTRVGASDNISSGESTFMVEMNETASIINNLSNRSLILLDEIGRGTSTYDGVSLAWSISEYIHNHPTKAKTLFATHYHELNELENKMDGIKNYNVSVKEHQGKIIFLRKLVKGGSAHSFGIHVAKLAGMPNEVLLRANEVLKHLEALREDGGDTTDQMKSVPEAQTQMNLFQIDDPKMKKIKDELDSLEINTMSPLDALLKLSELKKTLE